MKVKKYQITKMSTVKGINRIVNEIKKIDTIFNASIDKTTKILIVECNEPEQEIKHETYYKRLEDKILKAIRVYEKQAKIVSIDNVEVFRKVLYLNGLDCAYCGTRIENIAKKELNHQRIVVDYPTYRFIIETTDKSYIIDEKAAIRWVGLKTFALELSFLGRNDQIRTGWLLDKSKINDYFVFVWINELNHDTIQDISSIKNIVNKDALIYSMI